MKKLAYKLKEAAELLSVSYSTIYRMVERGEIAVVKVGGIRRIPHTEIQGILDKNNKKEVRHV